MVEALKYMYCEVMQGYQKQDGCARLGTFEPVLLQAYASLVVDTPIICSVSNT